MRNTFRKAAVFIVIVYEKTVSALVFISCFLIFFTMLTVGGNVLLRGTPYDMNWALELSEYVLVIVTLFGAGWLMRHAGHVRVDILPSYLTGKAGQIYSGVVFAIVSIICFSFMAMGLETMYEAYVSGATEIRVYFVFKRWILFTLFPIGGFILFVESARLSFGYFKKAFANKVDNSSKQFS